MPKEFWSIGEDPSGGQRCKHIPPFAPKRSLEDRTRETSRECGLLVYWMLIPGGARLVIEVTSLELRDMEQQHMSVEQIRDFLGLNWSGKR
jgi:hypothetical protein